ncbi:MAG: tetratricopeptide repeat protein [Anaerolineales bacterium]
MAGNRMRFDEAMQKANDYVWAEEWTNALKAYRQALREFPKDVSALMGYAWALLNARELDEALEIYKRLTRLTPADPGPYERIAEILKHQGETAEAAEMYYQAARRYNRQELTSKYVAALEASVALEPRNTNVWLNLLEVYKQQRDVDNAVLAAVWLAYLFQDQHRERAIEVCREMQRFISHDPRLAKTLKMLQSDRRIEEPPPIGSRVPMPTDELDEEGRELEEAGGGPLHQAQHRALEELAESIFEEDKPQVAGFSQMEIDMLIGKAIDTQTRGDLEEAQKTYESLLNGGFAIPPIHFNLGILYKEQGRYAKAAEQFEQSLAAPEYGLGSHFALGECLLAQENYAEALEHYLTALETVDVTTVAAPRAESLRHIYTGLAQSLVAPDKPEKNQELCESLSDFLGQSDWQEKIQQARRSLDRLTDSESVLSLAELVSRPNATGILQSVARTQSYQEERAFYRAQEELFHIIGKAADYLPLHHLLGDILLANDNFDQGIAKFRTIARTYETRGQHAQALAIYREIMQLFPLDVETQQKMIHLYLQQQRFEEAMAQQLQMADAYYQLAQVDEARETYETALDLAPQARDEQEWRARILHHIANLDEQRLNWRDAIKSYEEIIRIHPENEEAYIALFRLYPRVGKSHLGVNALDKLIRTYLKKRDIKRVVALLEDLIEEEPQNIPLRARITQLYTKLGQREKAIGHLDVLGDLQLEAGKKKAAIKTIETILSLNPPDRNAYADLYRELAGDEPPA